MSLVKLPMGFSDFSLVFFPSFLKSDVCIHACMYTVCSACMSRVGFYAFLRDVEARVGLEAFSQPLLYLIF